MPKKVLISWLLVNMRPTCNNKILVYWFTIFRENENKNLLKLINAICGTKKYGQPISQISVVFVYVPNFYMARQDVKPTLKFGFQVHRQFVCEEGFQDFCVGPIPIANYILISPQFKK